ncbi:MAG: Gfo/Idh/MocA family oxidoreductase [Acidimicrobiales bacterium]|nr:Gfo/Idh/MocA family oxidoreductase [Acidimicrobiales bacterium]
MTSRTAPLRVAVVGGGWVSRHRHLPSLRSHDGVEVVGMVVPRGALDPAVRTALAAEDPRFRFGNRLDEEWLDGVDAVMVGTPPDTHHPLVVDALRRGFHVLVEKPFALTVADAEEMISAAERNDRMLCVVHNLQFGRAASRAREQLASGALGELRGVFGTQSSNHERRLPTWYPDLPLGLFTDEAPHLVYLLQAFLPEATLESLYVGRPLGPSDRTPDLVTLAVRSGDLVGSLQMTFVGAVSEWLLVIMGTRGTMVLDFFRDVAFTVPNDHGHLPRNVLGTQLRAVGGHLADTVAAGIRRVRSQLDYGNDEVVDRFVTAVRTGRADPHIDGARGLDVVRVLEAAAQSRSTDAATP